jgi:3-dehydrosphinganine reductase
MRLRPADFEGRTVYVIGASMGIGLVVARRVASLGAHVLVAARRQAPLAAAVSALTEQRRSAQQRITSCQLDVGDDSETRRVLEAACAEFGVPDVLINCAGRAVPNYFERISYEQFVETLRVNLHGCWSTTAALLPHMRRRGGYIVHTASVAGLLGVFGYTDYCAAKFGVIGFCEALRSEVKPHGIGVSVLCPPDTDTPGFASENMTKPRETKAVSAGAKVLSAETVAGALFEGLARGRFLIIPGREGRLAALAKRLWPGLVERLMDAQIARAQRQRR